MRFFILLCCTFFGVQFVFANQYQSSDTLYKITARPAVKGSSRSNINSKIEFCSKNKDKINCEVLPKGVDHLFKGTSEDWSYFFMRCKSMNHVSNLADITLLAQGIIPGQILGTVLKGTSTAVRVGMTIGTEAGISLLGPRLYPEVDASTLAIEKKLNGKKTIIDGITTAHKMVRYLRKNNKKQKTLHPRYLMALKSLLSVCSESLGYEYMARQQSCERCHRLNNVRSPKKADPIDPTVQALKDYVESIEQ